MVLLSACKRDCIDTIEPVYQLYFYKTSLNIPFANYDYCYGIGSKTRIYPYTYYWKSNYTQNFRLILDLNKSQVDFVFVQASRQDTLGITYDKTIYYSTDCGYDYDMNITGLKSNTIDVGSGASKYPANSNEIDITLHK